MRGAQQMSISAPLAFWLVCWKESQDRLALVCLSVVKNADELICMQPCESRRTRSSSISCVCCPPKCAPMRPHGPHTPCCCATAQVLQVLPMRSEYSFSVVSQQKLLSGRSSLMEPSGPDPKETERIEEEVGQPSLQ
eukprot:267403-Pleurochrysis_carterae.AAC.2